MNLSIPSRSALALGLYLAFFPNAEAQESDLLDLANELLKQDQANEETAGLLSDSLTDCLLADTEAADAVEPVTFSVALGPDGKPSRPAMLIAPPPSEAGIAAINHLLRAEAAVADCAPLTIDNKVARDTVLTVHSSGERLSITDFAPITAAELPATRSADEEALALNRDNRREIQVRLGLAGHDAGGADGIFGRRTREAIALYQRSQNWPVTGYLGATQLEALVAATQTDYVAYLESRAQQTSTSRTTSRPRVYRGADGCLRYANGKIVPKRSIRCDAKGLLDF